MKNEIMTLYNEFLKIKEAGWIMERRHGKGACGYTFETLLNKEEDDFPVPDYHDIEIKTMHDNAKTNLHLFNLGPDGDYLFPIDRLLYEIGCPSKDDRNYKILFKTFNARDYTKMIYGRKVIIKVNYEKEKVELIVLNNYDENINIGISWSFSYLKERLLLKLNYLALVRASSCFICGEGYYHYHKIDFYKLKSFDNFLKLINDGIIEITFKIGFHNDDKKYGKVYDHGTDFSINVNSIDLLYDKIDIEKV